MQILGFKSEFVAHQISDVRNFKAAVRGWRTWEKRCQSGKTLASDWSGCWGGVSVCDCVGGGVGVPTQPRCAVARNQRTAPSPSSGRRPAPPRDQSCSSCRLARDFSAMSCLDVMYQVFGPQPYFSSYSPFHHQVRLLFLERSRARAPNGFYQTLFKVDWRSGRTETVWRVFQMVSQKSWFGGSARKSAGELCVRARARTFFWTLWTEFLTKLNPNFYVGRKKLRFNLR